MTDQGSTPPPPDPNEPGRFGAQPPAGGYGQAPPPSYGQGPPPSYGYGHAPPPGAGYGQPTGQPPPNYLVWAILSTVLCCFPLGIASIVFAAQVNNKYAAGDLAGAQASSRKAKTFAIWSAVIGVVGTILLVLILVAVAVSGSDTTSS